MTTSPIATTTATKVCQKQQCGGLAAVVPKSVYALRMGYATSFNWL